MKLRITKDEKKGRSKIIGKATPLLVHFLMICGVGVYALFGAMVMRKLETKTVAEVRLNVEKRYSELQENVIFAQALEVGPKHRRRRRHNETEFFRWLFKKSQQWVRKWRNREGRAAAEVMRSRRCVLDVIEQLTTVDCKAEMDVFVVKELDKCYHIAIEHLSHTKDVLFRNSAETVEGVGEERWQVEPWSFMDSLLFAFTVITTIGYGNVAPRSFGGRLFVIGYGLVGIPFTLLAIADLGKFLSEMMSKWSKAAVKWKKHLQGVWRSRTKAKGRYVTGQSSSKNILEKSQSREEIVTLENGKATDIAGSEDEDEEDQTLPLFAFFVVYIAMGGLMLATYEPDMDFFKAVYFNFVTLTSIGLGDIVPRSETYMALTIVYIAVGLALTTIAIEIAADTLKKLHYFGRKIENVGNVAIWFGGKKITMKALVRNLGDQFNLPTTVVKNLDLDRFVDQAIKVEEGEIETLRPPPFDPNPDGFGATFMDDVNQEVWKSDPTPPPSPSPLPSPSPSPSPSPPQPSTSQLIEEAPGSEPEEAPSEPSPIPTPPTMHTPSPEPIKDIPPPSPVPSPAPPHEPTPPPTPSPKLELEPEPELVPQPEPEPEPQSEIGPEPKSEPKPPPPPPEPPKRAKSHQLTPAEIAAQKRRAYSEEAWRRYQEYQKQWKKFRQTQKTGTPSSSASGRGSSGPESSKSSTNPGTPESSTSRT
uniref:TWiK family of potassium channels protein 7 n=1 Tax=Haemonchus contortus TaxID=6289 RepID=A0A7I4YRD0_HAECO